MKTGGKKIMPDSCNMVNTGMRGINEDNTENKADNKINIWIVLGVIMHISAIVITLMFVYYYNKLCIY